MGSILSSLFPGLCEAIFVICLVVVALFLVCVFAIVCAVCICCPEVSKHKKKQDIDKGYKIYAPSGGGGGGGDFNSVLAAAQRTQGQQVDALHAQRKSSAIQGVEKGAKLLAV